jgi:hypothetical protein
VPFLERVGLLTLFFGTLWFLHLVLGPDSWPSTRDWCWAHPREDGLILANADGDQIEADCKHSGIAAVIVEVPTLIVNAFSGIRAHLTAPGSAKP